MGIGPDGRRSSTCCGTQTPARCSPEPRLSWLKITVFYCIYYSCLAGFWIACMNIFFATLPENIDGPKWQQADSIIGVNPGVGLRPRNTDARIDSQMFVLEQGDTNIHMSEHEGEGDLNADYVARTEKF